MGESKRKAEVDKRRRRIDQHREKEIKKAAAADSDEEDDPFSKKSYFKQLEKKTGQNGKRLNGKSAPPLSSNLSKGKALGSGGGKGRKKRVEEVVGSFRFIYEIEPDGTRTLVRRLPNRQLNT